MIEHRVYGSVKNIKVEKLKEVFSTLSYVDFALLFGSRATGRFNYKSDYDIAVFGDSDLSYGIQAEVWSDLLQKLDIDMNDMDIVDLKKADGVLRDSIKECYVRLKGNPDEISRLLK